MKPDRERRIREYALTSGELGSSGGQTVMVALLPVLLAPHAPSALWIGAVIAAEGLFAMLVPYAAGALSDRLPDRLARRFGRRNFFLILAAPVMAAALIVTPLQDGFWRLAIPAFVFFAALHAFITPLRTLVLDTVPQERWGRVQGTLGALHSGGLGYGLVAGGLLFAIWQPLPFVVAAALILAMTAVTYFATPGGAERRAGKASDERGNDRPGDEDGKARPGDEGGKGRARDEGHDDRANGKPAHESEFGFWRDLAGRSEVRWYLLANSLWTGSVDGLRPYIFLFAVVVLGITVAEASLVLAVLLAGAGAGAIFVGRLGDRYGRGRLLLAAALLTGVIMMLGVAIRTVPLAIVVLVPAGFGAAALISLPLPVFAELAHRQEMGHYTGVYGMSMGVARFAAPLLVGAAIDIGARVYPDLEGYPLMWPVVGLLALLSVLALWRADRAAGGALLAPGNQQRGGGREN